MSPANNHAREVSSALPLSDLENLHRQLLEDSDVNTCLNALDRLPLLLNQLSQHPIDAPQMRRQTRELLTQLSDRLNLADARLRRAQLSVRTELHELDSQQEWVRASRQTT